MLHRAACPRRSAGATPSSSIPPRAAGKAEIAIEAHGLTRRFGTFTAVDHVTLSIERGEIFGFLGSNGCGKSTTMKMLTGLLPPTEGTATLFGSSVEAGSMEVRKNLGYMTQAFSLYGELTVRQNLVLHARLYHLPPDKAKARIDELVERFGLGAHLDALAEALPMGLRQRLSLAVAVLHEPQILILDEPTSGVDPVARDSFWELLIDLSRKQGVTIFVTTHFMNEGMRCDRISLMNAGQGAGLRRAAEADRRRAAPPAWRRRSSATWRTRSPKRRVARRRQGRAAAASRGDGSRAAAGAARSASAAAARCGRMLAYARNETMQILRDPVRLAFAFLGSALLMLVFGFGITTDVEHIRYAALDRDQSPESRALPRAVRRLAALLHRHAAGPLRRRGARAAAVGRRLAGARDPAQLRPRLPPRRRPRGPGAGRRRDDRSAARPSRSTCRACTATMLQDPASGLPTATPQKYTADIEERYMYNPTFESIYSIVPSVPALLLLLIPAILMTVSIVREKELGSMINFYVTPTGRLEYLLGKQLPYIAIGMINFFILTALALIVFGVPIKGSFLMLTLCTLLYVTATTGIGMVTSTFTSSQVAAVFVTAILTIVPTIQFSGLLQPVSTLEGSAGFIGSIWPATYYMHSSLGAYTKGLGPALMLSDILVPRLLHPGAAGHQHARPEESRRSSRDDRCSTSSGSGSRSSAAC